MLAKSNNEFARKDQNLYELSLHLAAEFERYLTALFEQAIAKKELKDNVAAIEYARFFQIHFTGLRGYFNRPGVEDEQQPMIDQMFTLLKAL